MFVYMNALVSTRTNFRSWYVVGVLSLAYAVSIIDRLIMPISIQQVRHSLGVSDFEISLMMGMGPTLVAGLSDLVFHSEARLGAALASFTAICAGGAALL